MVLQLINVQLFWWVFNLVASSQADCPSLAELLITTGRSRPDFDYRTMNVLIFGCHVVLSCQPELSPLEMCSRYKMKWWHRREELRWHPNIIATDVRVGGEDMEMFPNWTEDKANCPAQWNVYPDTICPVTTACLSTILLAPLCWGILLAPLC